MGKTVKNTKTKERNIQRKFDRWYYANKGIYESDEINEMVLKNNP